MDFERKTLSNLGFTSQDKFTYEVYYQNENTLVNIYNEKSAHIDVSLYDLAGNKVVTLKNEFVSQGNILIDIRSQFPHVYAGLYILRVMKSDQNYSKKIMLY